MFIIIFLPAFQHSAFDCLLINIWADVVRIGLKLQYYGMFGRLRLLCNANIVSTARNLFAGDCWFVL